MTYSLEGENTLKQVIKMPDGKTAYFVREFTDNDVKM
ncbi:jg23092, partial [Pararge aegeria aegeria]